MKPSRLLVALFCAIAATNVSAALVEPPPQLTIVVRGHPPLAPLTSPLNDRGDSVVIFTDEPVEVTAILFMPNSVATPALEAWWKSVRITIGDKNGIVRTLTGSNEEPLEARIRGELVAGKRTNFGAGYTKPNIARFSVPALPTGDYWVRGEYDQAKTTKSVTSFNVLFHIRAGDEDRDIERLRLRVVAERSSSFDDFKAAMTKLLTLEPDNSGYMEQIADRSLNVAPPAETLKWYRLARESRLRGIERRNREAGNNVTPEERDHQQTLLNNLELFEKVYPYYKEHQHDLRLVIIGNSGSRKLYAWQRTDGGIVGIIDAKDPSIVRPIDRVDR